MVYARLRIPDVNMSSSMELICVGCPQGCGTGGMPFELFSMQSEEDDSIPPQRTVIYRHTGSDQRVCYEIGNLIQYFVVERTDNNQRVPRHPSNRIPFLESDVRRIVRYWRDVLGETIPVELTAPPQPGAFDAANQEAIQEALGGDVDITATEHPDSVDEVLNPLSPRALATSALRMLPYMPTETGASIPSLTVSHPGPGGPVYYIFSRGQDDNITVTLEPPGAELITRTTTYAAAEALLNRLNGIDYVQVPPVLLSLPPSQGAYNGPSRAQVVQSMNQLISPPPVQRSRRGRDDDGDTEHPSARRRLAF